MVAISASGPSIACRRWISSFLTSNSSTTASTTIVHSESPFRSVTTSTLSGTFPRVRSADSSLRAQMTVWRVSEAWRASPVAIAPLPAMPSRSSIRAATVTKKGPWLTGQSKEYL